MKLLKLNMRGIAHLIIPALVVVTIAAVGTYVLVASHADSCTPASGAVSTPVSSVSGAACTPTSTPVSYVVSAPPAGIHLVSQTSCYLGTWVNGKLSVYYPTQAHGTCYYYSNGHAFYYGYGESHVGCTVFSQHYNKYVVCEKQSFTS